MAYPLLAVAALAASAAGTGMSIAAQEKAKGAMASARKAEEARQRGYQDEASAEFDRSLEQSSADTAQGQLQAGEQARLSAYEQAQQARLGAPSSPAGGGQGPRVIATPGGAALARERSGAEAAANAWTNALNQSSAKLGSYQDWGLQQGIKNTRARQQLGVFSDAARGSANVLPVEMEAASHEGDSLRQIGSILSALGFVGGVASGTGAAGMGAASAPTAAQTAAMQAGFGPVNSAYAARLAQPNPWLMWSTPRMT